MAGLCCHLEKFAFKLTQVVGRINVLVIVGSFVLFFCWLLARVAHSF